MKLSYYKPRLKIELQCKNCDRKFNSPSHNGKRKFCSKECRSEFTNNEWKKANNRNLHLPTGTVGTISELLVCTDLLQKGFEVFRSTTPNCSCDLAILKNKILYRIEVTTGTVSGSGKITYPYKDKNKYDILAIVTKDGKIIYNSEMEMPF